MWSGCGGGGVKRVVTRGNELKRCMNIPRLSRATTVYYVTLLQTPFVCMHAVQGHALRRQTQCKITPPPLPHVTLTPSWCPPSPPPPPPPPNSTPNPAQTHTHTHPPTPTHPPHTHTHTHTHTHRSPLPQDRPSIDALYCTSLALQHVCFFTTNITFVACNSTVSHNG